MSAPGTAAPLASRTVPESVAKIDCAEAAGESKSVCTATIVKIESTKKLTRNHSGRRQSQFHVSSFLVLHCCNAQLRFLRFSSFLRIWGSDGTRTACQR